MIRGMGVVAAVETWEVRIMVTAMVAVPLTVTAAVRVIVVATVIPSETLCTLRMQRSVASVVASMVEQSKQQDSLVSIILKSYHVVVNSE